MPSFELWLARGASVVSGAGLPSDYYFFYVIPPDIDAVRAEKAKGYGVRFQRLRLYVRFRGAHGGNPFWVAGLSIYTIDDSGDEVLVTDLTSTYTRPVVERDEDITWAVERSMGLNVIKVSIYPMSLFSPKVAGDLWLRVYGSWVRG